MSETLIVTLTLTTVVTFLALLVGGVIGWVARQHSYDTTPQTVYAHPETVSYTHLTLPTNREV